MAEKPAVHAAPGKKAEAPKQPARKDALPAKPLDPAAILIRDSNPQTPVELLRAIDALLSLDALPVAEEFFKKLAAMQLSDEQRVELSRQFDAGVLLRIAQTKSFGPAGPKFVQSVHESMRKRQEDPREIARLIDGLGSPQEDTRITAQADLLQAGRAAIGPLLRVLGNPQRKNKHADARTVLVNMGASAIEPLLAVLDSADADLKPQIVAVLAQSGDPRAVEALLVESVAPGAAPQIKQQAQAAVHQSFGDVPTEVTVARRLIDVADAYLRGDRRLPMDENGLAELWQYHPRTGELTSQRLPANQAAAIRAAWLARRLLAVVPGSATAEHWHLLTNLYANKLLGGMSQPLAQGSGRAAFDHALSRGPAVMGPVLALALKKNHVPAAIAALEVLAASKDKSLLSDDGREPSALLKAASHNDRRIRLAAIEAITALRPTRPLYGLSAVSKGLMEFANVSGARRAVVADPRADRADMLAALLDQDGFSTAVATTGREAFHEAAASPEVELMLVVSTIERPDVEGLLQQLRRDPRTARIPVGLIADPDKLYRAEGIALADMLTTAFVRPRDVATMQERVRAIEDLPGVNFVTHAERRVQAARALAIIAALTEKPQQLYDFQGVDAAVEPALMVPELAPAAMKVLARCRTPRAQKALADLASAGTQSIDTRKAAAAAFGESVKRHGIQLSIAQIQEQADRYDQSAALDQPTQDVLWSLLDTMQKTRQPPKEKVRS